MEVNLVDITWATLREMIANRAEGRLSEAEVAERAAMTYGPQRPRSAMGRALMGRLTRPR